MAPPLPRDCRSIMGMAFTIHTLPEPDRAQQIDCSGFQHPGPNSQQDMLAALPFQHDAIDAVSIKDMGQKQSSRPAADDCHLGSHRQLHHHLSQTGCDYKQGGPDLLVAVFGRPSRVRWWRPNWLAGHVRFEVRRETGKE